MEDSDVRSGMFVDSDSHYRRTSVGVCPLRQNFKFYFFRILKESGSYRRIGFIGKFRFLNGKVVDANLLAIVYKRFFTRSYLKN